MLMSIFDTEQERNCHFTVVQIDTGESNTNMRKVLPKKKRKMENGILSHWKTEPLTHMWLCCPLNGLFSLFMGKVLFLQWKGFWFHIVSTFKDHYSCQVNPRWLGLTYLMNSEDNLLTELKQKLFMQIPQQLIEKESASKLLKTALCVWGFLPGWRECSVTRWWQWLYSIGND